MVGGKWKWSGVILRWWYDGERKIGLKIGVHIVIGHIFVILCYVIVRFG